MDNRKIFISFSSKESDEANRICGLLENNGFNCFICSRDLIAGEEYAAQLIENIASSNAVVLLLSNNSNNSPHVLREVEYAVSNKIPILVYSLEDVELSKSMAYYIMTHHWIPCVEDRDSRLVEGLNHVVSGEKAAKTVVVPTKSIKAPVENKKNNKTAVILGLILAVAVVAVIVLVIGIASGWFSNSSESGKDNDVQQVADNSVNKGDNELVDNSDGLSENDLDNSNESTDDSNDDTSLVVDNDVTNDNQTSNEVGGGNTSEVSGGNDNTVIGEIGTGDSSLNDGSDVKFEGSGDEYSVTVPGSADGPTTVIVTVLGGEEGESQNSVNGAGGNGTSGDVIVGGSSGTTDVVVEPVEDILPIKEYELGEHVLFGSYLGEPIDWRVIKINDNNTMVMIANDILTMKIFDASEGGVYNEYEGVNYYSYENHIIEDDALKILVRGNNEWRDSNLRSWLNSDKEVVSYNGMAPTRSAAGKCFYSTEPGFLNGFSREEKAALVEVTNSTVGNSLSKDLKNGTVKTKDKVYLLSYAELGLLSDAGISAYAWPNDACLAQDAGKSNYKYYAEAFDVSSYYWWLRDGGKNAEANQCYAVTTEYYDDKVELSSVGICEYGVRPVICVDLTNDILK